MKCEKSGNHTISNQSLLLSTTVLNDIGDREKVEVEWMVGSYAEPWRI